MMRNVKNYAGDFYTKNLNGKIARAESPNYPGNYYTSNLKAPIGKTISFPGNFYSPKFALAL